MNDFLAAAALVVCIELGLIFRTVPADGKFYPLDVEGKTIHNGAGRIRLFPDGEGGQVWNHITKETRIFWANSDQTLTPADQAKRRQREMAERERARKELSEARGKASKTSCNVLDVALPPNNNAYLLKKGVMPTDMLREIPLETLINLIGYHPKAKGKSFINGQILIVPVTNLQGVTTIEMIDESGLKAGLAHGQKKGCFWITGKFPDGDGTGLTIGIGEGVATMLTYHMSSGNTGIAALSCGNLTEVAQLFRGKYPNAKIVIISDIGNGEAAAVEAARAVNALIVKPNLPEGSTGTDINDVHTELGIAEAQRQINGAIMVAPYPLSPTDTDIKTETASERQWPEPTPLPKGLPPVMALEPEMIPVPLRGWLMDIADRMQIPPDFSTAAAIVALGSLIGRTCGIHPKRYDDWLVVPNIWGMVIGRPSLMKTPAITESQKPLVRLETEAKEEYRKEFQAQEIDQEIEKVTRAAICEDVKRAVKKRDTDKIEQGRSMLAELGCEAPVTRKRYQTQDGTTEKIGEILIENPRGLLVNRDELIGYFHSLDKSGREGDRAFYLESWTGTRGYTYDRIGRGTLDIEALCISIFGAVTPGPLSNYVYQANRGGNGDDGLLQRFQLMVWPDVPNTWKNVDRFPDTSEKNRAWEIFKTLAGNIPGAVKEDGGDIPALRFSPEGQVIFDTWRHELETRLRSDHGLKPSLESHLAKYRSLMPSLALIFHLVEAADGSTAPGPVSEQAALMAAAWCQYLESHAVRVYGSALTEGMEAAREIIKHIRRGTIQDGVSVRDLWRPQWSRLTTSDEVKAGLDILTEYDWLTVQKVSTGGRPSETVRLNPRIKL